MPDIYRGPYATALGGTGTIDATAKTNLNATIDSIRLLIGSSPAGSIPAHPDFIKMSPDVQAKLELELLTLRTAIAGHA